MKISHRWSDLIRGSVIITMTLLVTSCAKNLPLLPTAAPQAPNTTDPQAYEYLIGPGDNLGIFVWRNPDVSTSVSVRPDGKVTTPLVEDLPVSGKTPTEVARQVEEALSHFIKDPIVSVTVDGFIGPFSEQVRVVGEATSPQALPYRQHMRLLDLMISVGGLTEFADGDNAVLIRVVDGQLNEYRIELARLIKEGDINANAEILPGDIIIIPEAWF